MVERRAGGESGVAAVTVLKGKEMWFVVRAIFDQPGLRLRSVGVTGL